MTNNGIQSASENEDQTPESVGGAGGKSATITVDLSKLADVLLVHRAVINDWPVAQSVKNQISDQLPDALDAAAARMDAADGAGDGKRYCRHVNQFLKLAKLLLAMEARNMIDEGCLKSSFPYLRKRYPEHRQRRHGRPDEDVKVQADLARLLTKLSAGGEAGGRSA
jgi:hypothetical protein